MLRFIQYAGPGLLSCALAGAALGQAPFCADPADPARPSKAARILWERKPPPGLNGFVFANPARIAGGPDAALLAIAESPTPDDSAGPRGPVERVLVRWSADGAALGRPVKLPVDAKDRITHLIAMEGGNFAVALQRDGDDDRPPLVLRIDREGKTVWRRPIVRGYRRASIGALHPLPDGGVLVGATAEEARVFRIAPNGRLKWDDRIPLVFRAAAVRRDRLRLYFVGGGAVAMREYEEEPTGELKAATRPLAAPSRERDLYWPLELADGRVLVPGFYGGDAVLLRFEPDLNAAEIIVAAAVGRQFHKAFAMPDGGFVALASDVEFVTYDTQFSGQSYCFVRFDKTEREILRRTYSLGDRGNILWMLQIADGSFVLFGLTDGGPWMVRLAVE